MDKNPNYYCWGTPCKVLQSWIEPPHKPPYRFDYYRRVWLIQLPSQAQIVTPTLHLNPDSTKAIQEIF